MKLAVEQILETLRKLGVRNPRVTVPHQAQDGVSRRGLPIGGDREAALAYKLESAQAKLCYKPGEREQERADMAELQSLWERTDGRYYTLQPLVPVSPRERWSRWMKEANETHHPDEALIDEVGMMMFQPRPCVGVADFTMEWHCCVVRSRRKTEALVTLRQDGRAKSVLLPTKAMSRACDFRCWLLEKGMYSFAGGENTLCELIAGGSQEIGGMQVEEG